MNLEMHAKQRVETGERIEAYTYKLITNNESKEFTFLEKTLCLNVFWFGILVSLSFSMIQLLELIVQN